MKLILLLGKLIRDNEWIISLTFKKILQELLPLFKNEYHHFYVHMIGGEVGGRFTIILASILCISDLTFPYMFCKATKRNVGPDLGTRFLT